MIPFYSKRNQVFSVMWHGRKAVEKHFHRQEDWERELEIYYALPLRHPELLNVGHNALVMECCDYPTMLEELERQERDGFLQEPWEQLARWLVECDASLHLLPEEGNLRNFLWDVQNRQILGLDFEGYDAIPLQESAATIIAALCTYIPEDTAVKQQAAALLAQRMQVTGEKIAVARGKLQNNRMRRPVKTFSAIVLAGGKSRRMGCDKAALVVGGKTMLERQVERVRALGIEDIMVSGAACPQLPGTRVIGDDLPERGPLGGLYACLRQAQNPQCLILSVDVPLIPISVLAQMCRAHVGGATVLHHAGGDEPLIGVYDTSVTQQILPLIKEGGASVRSLLQQIPWTAFSYLGPKEYLMNCNTPEEFFLLQEKFES